MNILEELWYGNIEPAEYDISPSKEYKQLLQLISRNEDKLLATMTDTRRSYLQNTQTVYGSIRSWRRICFSKTVSAWVQG